MRPEDVERAAALLSKRAAAMKWLNSTDSTQSGATLSAGFSIDISIVIELSVARAWVLGMVDDIEAQLAKLGVDLAPSPEPAPEPPPSPLPRPKPELDDEIPF